MAKKQAICDSFCDGCVFKSYFNGCDTLAVCNYYLKTGFRRPCPAGTGCTVKETGKRWHKWRAEDEATWRQKLAKDEWVKRMKECREAKPMRTLICPECGQEFQASHGHQKYCSSRCKNRVAQRAWTRRQYEKAKSDTGAV